MGAGVEEELPGAFGAGSKADDIVYEIHKRSLLPVMVDPNNSVNIVKALEAYV
jgi:heptaprenylglyceryl phosphate synthase